MTFSFQRFPVKHGGHESGLSIDVDDIVEAFAEFLDQKRGAKEYHSRLEEELLYTLNLLDEFGSKATFFISGTALKYARQVLPEIVRRGHEIGSHGNLHRPVYLLSKEEFERDLAGALEEIEKYAGCRPAGYRAPGMTLLPAASMAVPVLEKLGFSYSSSLPPVPAPQHKFMSAPAYPFFWTDRLVELPVSSIRWLGVRFPACGSVYTRLYPSFFNTFLFNRARKTGKPLFIYFHPFELFTREAKAALKGQSLYGLHQRLYLMNIGSFEKKLRQLLSQTNFVPYRSFILNERFDSISLK